MSKLEHFRHIRNPPYLFDSPPLRLCSPPVSVVIRYRRPLVSPPRHLSYYLLVLVATRRPVWPSSFLVCLSCPRILFCLGSLALTLPAVQSVGLHLYLAHISYSS